MSATAPSADDCARLARLAAIAEALGNGNVEAQARALGERVAEGRFYVACVGQFKRGKSTLLNALVGATVLPVGSTCAARGSAGASVAPCRARTSSARASRPSPISTQ